MSPRAMAVLRWILLALLGLLAAVAVGVAAAALTSRQIGLSSEPIRAGEALAPQPGGEDRGRRRGPEDGHPGRGHRDPTTATTTAPTTTATVPTTATTTDSTTTSDEDEDEEEEEDD